MSRAAQQQARSGSSSSSSSKLRRGVHTLESLSCRLHDVDGRTIPQDLSSCFNSAVTRLETPCTGKLCACQVVPTLVYCLEEKQESHYRDLSDVLEDELHIKLPQLATKLLNGGHSTRAFRRTTEAFEM
jgi:hypothetical protein